MKKNKWKPEEVISGSWGQVWFDGEYMAEVTACKAEVGYKKTEVPQTCTMIPGQKITGLEPKGELKFNHVNSTVMKKEQEAIRGGKTAVHTIIIKVDDPDAHGAERVALYGCVFDKMILADFEANKLGERSYGFTFTDWDILESI